MPQPRSHSLGNDCNDKLGASAQGLVLGTHGFIAGLVSSAQCHGLVPCDNGTHPETNQWTRNQPSRGARGMMASAASFSQQKRSCVLEENLPICAPLLLLQTMRPDRSPRHSCATHPSASVHFTCTDTVPRKCGVPVTVPVRRSISRPRGGCVAGGTGSQVKVKGSLPCCHQTKASVTLTCDSVTFNSCPFPRVHRMKGYGEVEVAGEQGQRAAVNEGNSE